MVLVVAVNQLGVLRDCRDAGAMLGSCDRLFLDDFFFVDDLFIGLVDLFFVDDLFIGLVDLFFVRLLFGLFIAEDQLVDEGGDLLTAVRVVADGLGAEGARDG
jgi:hypothetical protein